MDVDALLRLLASAGPSPTARVLDRQGVSRATLMRTVRAAGDRVVVRGRARRTTYAAARPLRGRREPIPLFQIDTEGQAREAGRIQMIEPRGCALDAPGFAWPMDEAMRDGWFEGLPYPIADMRPQGYLGRAFARTHAPLLQVPEDPRYWSDDDVLHGLSVIGADLPGNLIVGFNNHNAEYIGRSTLRHFTRIASEFYPQLVQHCEEVLEEWHQEEVEPEEELL
jgi:hypothetical protein